MRTVQIILALALAFLLVAVLGLAFFVLPFVGDRATPLQFIGPVIGSMFVGAVTFGLVEHLREF